MNVWPYLEHQKGHFVLFSRKILVVKLPHKLKLCKTILVAHVQSKPCHTTVYLKGFRWKKENATDASFTFLSNKKILILSSPWMKILMISQCMSLWKKSHPLIFFFLLMFLYLKPQACITKKSEMLHLEDIQAVHFSSSLQLLSSFFCWNKILAKPHASFQSYLVRIVLSFPWNSDSTRSISSQL